MNVEHESQGDLAPDECEVADHLIASRPVPAAGFRGALARHLAARDPGYRPRPMRLALMVAAYLVLGLLLIAAGALLGVGVL